MPSDMDEIIDLYKKYLGFNNVKRPLRGYLAGGWESVGRYIDNAGFFLSDGLLNIDDLHAEDFTRIYERYAGSINRDDDFIRTLEPFQLVPWTETAIGCPMNYTGKNIWAGPVSCSIDDTCIKIITEEENASVKKYGKFFNFLKTNFSQSYPTGQAIWRGLLDMAAATVGEQNFIYNLIDREKEMKKFISLCTVVFKYFQKKQVSCVPEFIGGNVIGQYYIWTPGTCTRLQEDVMSLLSPDLYLNFALECDTEIAENSDYSLFHLHVSAFYLLDFLLDMKGIKIIQVSKDEGSTQLDNMMAGLRKIQAAGKCLLLKGRFSHNNLALISANLKCGACAYRLLWTVTQKLTRQTKPSTQCIDSLKFISGGFRNGLEMARGKNPGDNSSCCHTCQQQ